MTDAAELNDPRAAAHPLTTLNCGWIEFPALWRASGVAIAAGDAVRNTFQPTGIVSVPMTTTTLSASVTHADPPQRPAAPPPVAIADGDALLVARAKRGDVGAFEQLYRNTIPRVYALCLRMTTDEGQARDLAHDAFVRAWESLDSYRGDSSFLSWIHRLTVNVVLQDLRSTRRREARVRLAEDHEGLDAAHEEGALDNITRLELQAALARLTPDARQVVVLHDIAGYRHDEIATLLGVAAGTIRSRLHHARRQLKDWMTP